MSLNIAIYGRGELKHFIYWVWDSGLAVGLAAKEVVGNMFGGASLFITRPFIIGEKIKVHITTSWSFFSN